MKKVLIYRSANFKTIDELMKFLKNSNVNKKIYILTQNYSYDQLLQRYPEAEIIGIKVNERFVFDEVKYDINSNKKLKKNVWDEIYIPISQNNTSGYIEFKKISKLLSYKKMYFFKPNQTREEISKINVWVECYKEFKYKSKEKINNYVKYIFLKSIYYCILLISLLYKKRGR